MAYTKEELKRFADALKSFSEGVKQLADQSPLDENNAQLQGQWTNFRAALTAFQDKLPTGGIRFEDFLHDVGTAMLDTQRSLDEASLEYLQGSQGAGHVVPSVFRMPRLEGEMKFALQKESSTGLNLVFFSDKEKASLMHQQTIKFEMVSVPAPVEAMEQRTMLQLPLMLDPAVRQRVMDAALPNLPAGTIADRVLILEAVKGTEYFLLYAGDGDFAVGLWQLTFEPQPMLKSIYRFETKVGTKTESAWRGYVFAIGDHQAKMLARPANRA